MKRRYHLIAIFLALFQLFNAFPSYALNSEGVSEEVVVARGIKQREVTVLSNDSSKSVYIDTYVYEVPSTKLLSGETESNIYIVKRVFPTEVNEDYPYHDETLSIFGNVTVTTSEYSDSYGSYKRIKQIRGNWRTSDNQVVVTQQKVGASQSGVKATGGYFTDLKEQTYGNQKSWTFRDPIASWPYIEDVSSPGAIFMVSLNVTVKDLFSGDTWTTGMNDFL
ncbi:hypothetical protein [Lacrimispora sp.]|uniref:hypothetical protein n=1 Tax=Lacrimispora sp. TaxID=2719234 RepID=UPI003460A504